MGVIYRRLKAAIAAILGKSSVSEASRPHRPRSSSRPSNIVQAIINGRLRTVAVMGRVGFHASVQEIQQPGKPAAGYCGLIGEAQVAPEDRQRFREIIGKL